MKQKHTKEPWRLIDIVIKGERCAFVGDSSEGPMPPTICRAVGAHSVAQHFENMKRVAACVNACAGMDDPAKEITTLKRRVEAGEALVCFCRGIRWDTISNAAKARTMLDAWDAAKEGSHE